MSGNVIRVDTDLSFNLNPSFTKWLVKSDALREPFVLIDVGVLGGENARWHALGDYLIVHGFDASKEVIGDLSKLNAENSNRHYHCYAVGNEDGERQFFYNPGNPSSSSFFEFSNTQVRTVPVRRLDTLLKQAVIPPADFLKVDVEGHERELFLGASDLLAAGLLGVDTETSFVTSTAYPQASFDLIRALLIRHALVMSDLNFNRIRRDAYQHARQRRGLPELPLEGAGKPATFNVLFCRDFASERNGGIFYEQTPRPPRVDQILKLMVIYELYGLNDLAVDTALTFSKELGHRLDVERAIDLLCENDAGAVREYLAEVKSLKSALVTVGARLGILEQELSADASRKVAPDVTAELEAIKATLSSVIVRGHELPEPDQITYGGHGSVDTVIPEDPNQVTRQDGAGILRVVSRPGRGRRGSSRKAPTQLLLSRTKRGQGSRISGGQRPTRSSSYPSSRFARTDVV